MNLITQVVGLIAFIFLTISFTKKNKKEIIKYQIASSSIFTLHYILLNAVGGIVTSLIILFRNILYYKCPSKQKKLSNICIILFIISGIIFFDVWYTLIPMIGGSVNTFLMTKGKKQVLIGGMVNSASWFTYNILAGSYIGVITESIIILTTLKNIKKTHK